MCCKLLTNPQKSDIISGWERGKSKLRRLAKLAYLYRLCTQFLHLGTRARLSVYYLVLALWRRRHQFIYHCAYALVYLFAPFAQIILFIFTLPIDRHPLNLYNRCIFRRTLWKSQKKQSLPKHNWYAKSNQSQDSKNSS